MNEFLVITYWTNAEYKVLADRLATSCAYFNLRYKGYDVGAVKNWKEGTEQKPHIITQAMDEYPEWDVLWVDADAYFVSKPDELFGIPKEYEAALYLEPTSLWGCTMYYRNSKWSRDLMKRWDEQHKATPKFSSDSNLRYVTKKIGTEKIYQLPPAYVWKHSHMRRRFPGATPVIIQGMVVTFEQPELRKSQAQYRTKPEDWK